MITLGGVRLADVDLDSVQVWIAKLSADRGPAVVIRACGVLTAVLDSAVKGKKLARNPARGVENLPRKQRKPRVYLNHAQVAALAYAAGQHRTLVLLR